MRLSAFILEVLLEGQGGSLEILLTLLFYSLGLMRLLLLSGIFFVIF